MTFVISLDAFDLKKILAGGEVKILLDHVLGNDPLTDDYICIKACPNANSNLTLMGR